MANNYVMMENYYMMNSNDSMTLNNYASSDYGSMYGSDEGENMEGSNFYELQNASASCEHNYFAAEQDFTRLFPDLSVPEDSMDQVITYPQQEHNSQEEDPMIDQIVQDLLDGNLAVQPSTLNIIDDTWDEEEPEIPPIKQEVSSQPPSVRASSPLRASPLPRSNPGKGKKMGICQHLYQQVK